MHLNSEDQAERLVDLLKCLRLKDGLKSQGLNIEIETALLQTLGIDITKPSQYQQNHFLTKLRKALQSVAKTVPDSSRLIRNALNLDDIPGGWLERAGLVARDSGVSRRTIIRRTDAALTLLATEMLARSDGDDVDALEKVALKRLKDILDRREEIRIEKFDVVVRVHADRVEVQERVQIVSQSEAAQFYVIGKTLPYKKSRVTTTVLDGALLRDVEQPNEHWLLELLLLPTPLPTGTHHRFTVVHDARDMAPMWTATTMHEADELSVTVWYADRKSRPVWLVDEFPPKLLNADDIRPILVDHAVELKVDRSGAVSHIFTRLKPNRSYGLAWMSLEPDN